MKTVSHPFISSTEQANMQDLRDPSKLKDLKYYIYDLPNEEAADNNSSVVKYKENQKTCSLIHKHTNGCYKRTKPDMQKLSDRDVCEASSNISRGRPIRNPDCGLENKPSPVCLDWNNYHRLDVIHSFMDSLEQNYPSICTTGTIGQSLEGRDLKVLRISNSNATNASVWLDAGIHAREWIAPATATYIANIIAQNFSSMPEFITNKDWYFLPVMNPDGYEYSHTHDRMWRKNRAWHAGRCVGVDLNRNFSVGWGCRGSSETPSNAFYHGPEPFSEPECTAVRDMLVNSGIQFSVYMTLHSYGQVILFPFAYQETLCPSYVRLLEGATIMSRPIFGPVLFKLFKVAPPKKITQVWEVTFTKEGQRLFVKALDTAGAINIWKEERSTMDIMVEGPRAAQVAGILHEREIPYSVAIGNVNNFLEREQGNAVPKTLRRISSTNALIDESTSRTGGKTTRRNKERLKRTHSKDSSSASSSLEDIWWGSHHHNKSKRPRYSGQMKDKRVKDTGRVMDWKGYHRLDVIYAFLDALVYEFPYRCSVSVIGKSVEGRDLKMLKISNGDPGNTGVWIDSAIHPREWISPAVVTYIADHLVRTYDDQPDTVTNKDWYIVPVLNPDGYEYTHTLDRMWRKNRAPYGECVGVDLNRNFSYGWGEKGEEGSSEDPGNIFFRGSKPFSEPETAAVKRAITEANTTFKVFLSFHSYGEVIIFPWGYTSDACPDYVELLEGGTAMAKAIFNTNQHTYKVGSTKDLMYYASGTSTDWAYAVANIPYSYMIELRGKQHRFLLPKEEIIPTATEILNGVMRLMDFVDKKCNSVESCSCPK